MEKAYDLKEFGAQLKGKGLDLAEEAVKLFIEELFVFLDESAKLSATPLDNVAAALYPEVKKFLLVQADKLDGAQG